MTKKLLSFLCITFIFISSTINADIMHEPTIIKINDISFYQEAANRIIEDAKGKNILVTYDNDKNLTINDSELLDEVIKLYNEAISEKGGKNIIWKESDKIMVFV